MSGGWKSEVMADGIVGFQREQWGFLRVSNASNRGFVDGGSDVSGWTTWSVERVAGTTVATRKMLRGDGGGEHGSARRRMGTNSVPYIVSRRLLIAAG